MHDIQSTEKINKHTLRVSFRQDTRTENHQSSCPLRVGKTAMPNGMNRWPTRQA
ncbi:hypothetical protein KFK09_025452 [Dendrobium nobile]|uniref:Uncharacterized protein n=1 Tax=Dendrobium nobile TaxID=94219 RepID=A0A8T3AHR7_DENNO|nr:hypothetical protein KFK09_025452 [Dendrobium nobile]